MKVVADLELCACCISVLANGDDSGCRDYHGHADHALRLIADQRHLVCGSVCFDDEWNERPCDGCGERGVVHTAHVLGRES